MQDTTFSALDELYPSANHDDGWTMEVREALDKLVDMFSDDDGWLAGRVAISLADTFWYMERWFERSLADRRASLRSTIARHEAGRDIDEEIVDRVVRSVVAAEARLEQVSLALNEAANMAGEINSGPWTNPQQRKAVREEAKSQRLQSSASLMAARQLMSRMS